MRGGIVSIFRRSRTTAEALPNGADTSASPLQIVESCPDYVSRMERGVAALAQINAITW